MYPFTCARAVAATSRWPRLAGQRKRRHKTARVTPRQRRKERRDKVGSPRQEPCRDSLRSPSKGLCRGNLPNTSRAATLEPKSSDTINNTGTKAREAPAWRHADLCEDQGHIILDENRNTEVAHAGAQASPLPGTSAGPQPGPHLPRLHPRSNTALNPPTRQAPAWRRAASRPTQQALAWWHADLREDSATAPTQQPANQRGVACLVSLVVR